MEAPKCMMCGERHWSRQPCAADRRTRAVAEAKPVTAVTHAPPVTHAKPKAAVTHAPKAKEKETPSAERQRKWRAAHPEKHAAQQRAARARKKEQA